MPPRSLLTPSQIALLTALSCEPVVMTLAELSDTPRGRDLQRLGQSRLVRAEPDDVSADPATCRFRFSRRAGPEQAMQEGPPIVRPAGPVGGRDRD